MIKQTLMQQLEQHISNDENISQRLESRLELRLESSLAAKVLLQLNRQELGKAEIAEFLGHKAVSGELNKQIKNLLEQQLIERTIPDKPTSSKQKYRLTGAGQQLLQHL